MPATDFRRHAAFRPLQKLLQKTSSLSLAQRHWIGQQVRELLPAREYGTAAMAGLAEALGRPESFATSLLAMRKFSEEYRRGEVARLSKPSTTTGFQLQWSHFALLLSLDVPQRKMFQRKCLTNEWSVRELHRRIKLRRGARTWGGRKPARPRSVARGVREVIDASAAWLRKHEAWFEGEQPAVSVDALKERDKLSESLVNEAMNGLISMEQSLAKAKQMLQKIRSEVKKRQSK